jgi:hypothetical protein
MPQVSEFNGEITVSLVECQYPKYFYLRMCCWIDLVLSEAHATDSMYDIEYVLLLSTIDVTVTE